MSNEVVQKFCARNDIAFKKTSSDHALSNFMCHVMYAKIDMYWFGRNINFNLHFLNIDVKSLGILCKVSVDGKLESADAANHAQLPHTLKF